MKISEIFTYFTDTIFRRDIREWRNPVIRWLVQQYRLLFYTARGLLEHGTIVRSAALTFYTLMSLVPIVAVVFAVVKGFGLADGLVENLYALFPQNPEIVDYIVTFAEKALARTQGGVVAAVALVMLFWAVIRVFGSIESAFNNIWEVKVERSLTRQYTDYIAVVMIVPVLWIVANAVGSYAQQMLGFDGSWYFTLLSHLASMVIIWIMFTILYIIIPNTKVKFRSALMAGIVAGTLFLLFQWGYLYIQRWMTSYNAIYGSFAALPLLLIWLQTSWQILLFGGELSFAYQNIARFGEERESLLISYDQRRKILLAVMLTVVRHFRGQGGATPADEIRAQLDLPTRIVNDILYQLVQAGQLIAVPSGDGEREVAFAPAHDPQSMTVYGILEAVEKSGQTTVDLTQSDELTFGTRSDRRQRKPCRSIGAGRRPKRPATGTVVRPQRRTGGGCRRTRRNAVDGRPGTAGRRGHIPDLCERQGRRGGSRGAAPACRSRRRPYCGERAARCASRPCTPRRLLSAANLHQRAQRGFFANPPLPRNRGLPPASRTRSLRPPSFAHGGVGRLGLPRQGAPRGGFRLQLRQPHVRRRRRHRTQCGPALRRSQTAPGRDRRQGTRRRLPGRRADRPRRAQRPAHDGTPPCTARRRPPTRKHLLDNK